MEMIVQTNGQTEVNLSFRQQKKKKKTAMKMIEQTNGQTKVDLSLRQQITKRTMKMIV